jgi:hypothetical protein
MLSSIGEASPMKEEGDTHDYSMIKESEWEDSVSSPYKSQ